MNLVWESEENGLVCRSFGTFLLSARKDDNGDKRRGESILVWIVHVRFQGVLERVFTLPRGPGEEHPPNGLVERSMRTFTRELAREHDRLEAAKELYEANWAEDER